MRYFTDEMAPTFSKQELNDLLAYRMATTALLEHLDAVLDWDQLAAVVADIYAAPRGGQAIRRC